MAKEKREPKPDAHPWEIGMVVSCRGSGFRRDDISIGKVVRLTKTKVIVKFNAYDLDFSRHSGDHKYDTYSWSSIRPATQEDFDTVKHNKVAYKLSKVKWSEFPLDTLVEIERLIGKKEEEKAQ